MRRHKDTTKNFLGKGPVFDFPSAVARHFLQPLSGIDGDWMADAFEHLEIADGVAERVGLYQIHPV